MSTKSHHRAPRPERFEVVVIELLEEILQRLERLDIDLDLDRMDRALRPYGDDVKQSPLRRRGR